MKIKYLAIALLATVLISTPLLAKDKVKPVKVVKEMDKASPANLSIQTSTDEMEVAKKKDKLVRPARTEWKRSTGQGLAGGSAASAIPPSITALEVTAPNQTKGLSIASDKVETKSSKAYIKIDDIKGESQDRAADTISPDRIEFKKAIAAPDVNNGSGNGGKAVEATDYNSSRSNKADTIAAPDPDDGDDDSDQKATDYNSSRSNKSLAIDLDTDGEDNDCDDLKENERCVDGHVTVLK